MLIEGVTVTSKSGSRATTPYLFTTSVIKSGGSRIFRDRFTSYKFVLS